MLWAPPEVGTPLLHPPTAVLICCIVLALLTGDATNTDRLTGLERCPDLAKGDIGV